MQAVEPNSLTRSVSEDPHCGQSTESFPKSAWREPDARAGFAGPNIIEQTIRQKLPPGFQRSEFLLEHGAVDMIVHRIDMRDTLASILSKLTHRPAA